MVTAIAEARTVLGPSWVERSPPPVYHSGAACPGCRGANWYIGRASAECGNCGTMLPLEAATPQPDAIVRKRKGSGPWR